MRERQKSGGVGGADGADRNHRNRRGHLRGARPTQAGAPLARSPGISQGLGPQADPMPAWPRVGGAARLGGSLCGTRPWPGPSLQGHLVHSAWVGAARVALGPECSWRMWDRVRCCPARVCTGACGTFARDSKSSWEEVTRLRPGPFLWGEGPHVGPPKWGHLLHLEVRMCGGGLIVT